MDIEVMGDCFKELTLELKPSIVIGLHQMNNGWKTILSTGKNICEDLVQELT